ncbi:hypothetical protein JHK85_027473 [Glycine max]|nr:hypothetical protein JHK85_027473 [Glycine max]
MGRGKADGKPRKRLVTTVLLLAIVGALFYLYSRKNGSSSIEHGSKSVKFGDDSAIPKTIPVCDDCLSELIPCLDRNFIYQTRLKLDLTLMEHYERHCPMPERRYNCLIPPPPGFQSSGPKAEIRYGGQIYLIPILQLRNLTRDGWL